MKPHLTLATLILTTASLPAAVLLEIDISNPAAVVIRATANTPAVTFSSINNYHGISLLDLLTSDFNLSGLIPTATLTPSGGGDSYNEWWITDLGSGPTTLNLYFNPEANASLQDFDENQPAFTGTATLDMGGAPLPSIGHTGNIVVGDATLTGPAIGTYTVVPEPSTAFLLSGTILLAFRRNRR